MSRNKIIEEDWVFLPGTWVPPEVAAWFNRLPGHTFSDKIRRLVETQLVHEAGLHQGERDEGKT